MTRIASPAWFSALKTQLDQSRRNSKMALACMRSGIFITWQHCCKRLMEKVSKPKYASVWQQMSKSKVSKLLWAVPSLTFIPCLSMFVSSHPTKQTDAKISNSAPDADWIIHKADSLYDSFRFEELYDLLKDYSSVENDEILWRLARAMMEKSKLISDKRQRKQLIHKAFCIIERAVALNDKNFACHKWYGILLDSKAEYEGTKARLSCAYQTKAHFIKASELNPKDPTTLYLLGIWCFTFADLPWYQRKIASAVFTTPPSSTYEEALKYFHLAEATDPNFYSKNTLMLGKTYLRLGNKKMSLLYLTKAREFPLNTEDDKETYKEAGELLRSMGIKVEDA